MALAELASLTYWYPSAGAPALDRVELALDGGLMLVAGASGSGKSTLLRVFNGLVPHFHGGRIAGSARVAGRDVVRSSTRELARVVGLVFQDPEQQAVYGLVEREVAFGLENLGVPQAQMRARVEEALAAVGALHLRGRRLATLSGGERQRVALASALALRPRLVALDEPTSQLDAEGAGLVARACAGLAGSGRCVVVAEHRLESLLPAASRLVLVDRGRVVAGELADLVLRLPSPPAVVRLAAELGWRPVPLAAEAAAALAPRLRPDGTPPLRSGREAWSLTGVTAGPGRPVIADVELAGREAEAVVLMGPNGGGKTTLLRVIAGLLPPLEGAVERRPGRVAYLPQNPAAILHRPTVIEEVRVTLERAGERDDPMEILALLGLEGKALSYPRDLSAGERQRAAIAAILAGSPAVALLDEPTRGMDLQARRALGRLIGRLRARGASVVLATHDSDLAAEVGDRVVEVGGGRTRELGPPERALAGDGPLATQIGRIYPGGPVTVEGVLARL